MEFPVLVVAATLQSQADTHRCCTRPAAFPFLLVAFPSPSPRKPSATLSARYYKAAAHVFAAQRKTHLLRPAKPTMHPGGREPTPPRAAPRSPMYSHACAPCNGGLQPHHRLHGELHDRGDDVPARRLQRLDRAAAAHARLRHHQLDVLGLHAGLVDGLAVVLLDCFGWRVGLWMM